MHEKGAEVHIYEMSGKRPRIHKTARVLQGAVVAGDVTIGPYALISWNAVVYSEKSTIEICQGVCVGDGALVHAKRDPVRIGDYSLIGHGAQICDASVEHHAMVGINAVVVDGACVVETSMLAADSLLADGARTTPGMVWEGRPAKEKEPRETGAAERKEVRARERIAIFDTLLMVDLGQVLFDE